MTTRSILRTAVTVLSLPALAGLIEVSRAQPLGAAESTRQPVTAGAVHGSPVSLSAAGQTRPAADLVRGGKLLRMTAPSYPLAAKQASVCGVVTVEARIGADGRVVQTSVLRGPSPLRRSAQDTVGSWRFEPTLLNGKAVERVAEVDFRFVLGRY
jgi:TonB family protein